MVLLGRDRAADFRGARANAHPALTSGWLTVKQPMPPSYSGEQAVTQRAAAFRPRWPEAPDPSCTPRMHGGTRSGRTPPRAHADQGWS